MTRLIALILSLVMFVFVIELIRRERLTFKYALGWLLASLTAMIMACFDQILFKLSSWLGFELPSNFIFFILLAILVFLSLLMTIFLCQENRKNNIIAQKLSILEFEVEELRRNKNQKDS